MTRSPRAVRELRRAAPKRPARVDRSEISERRPVQRSERRPRSAAPPRLENPSPERLARAPRNNYVAPPPQVVPAVRSRYRKKKIPPHKFGYYEDPKTHIVFDPNTRQAFGIQDHETGEVYALNDRAMDLCEKYRWDYTLPAEHIEEESDSSNYSEDESVGSGDSPLNVNRRGDAEDASGDEYYDDEELEYDDAAEPYEEFEGDDLEDERYLD